MSDYTYSLPQINASVIDPYLQKLRDGLNADEIKNLTDADKYYYNEKNFKKHLNMVKDNLDECRRKCAYIPEQYDPSFDFEACKKGCHIESPYYCNPCPNEEMQGKIFYMENQNNPFKGDCNESGDKYNSTENCKEGRQHFKDIWKKTYNKSEENEYKISNEKITKNDKNKCEGSDNFYEDDKCNEEITLKNRFTNLIDSYKEYKKEDRGTYDDMVNNMLILRKENNEKKSVNNTRMENLIKKYNTIQEGMTNADQVKEARQGRIEDNKLKGESEMYKKIAISILGITLLLITAKKLNNL